MSNPNEFGSADDGKATGDWPPAPPGTVKGNGGGPPAWQKPAIIAVTAAVGLLGVVVISKKRSGKSDDEIKDDLKRAGGKAASKAEEKGKDLWGLGKVKAAEAKEDFPGNAKKLADDIKTAGWEGGKDVKRGAQVAANKVQGLWEEEAAPNYGFLGWRHLPGFKPKLGK